MKAEIITIGDEILIGQIVDTNSAWMAQKLNEIGIEVVQISSIKDEKNHIFNALNEAKSRAELILITGGLGPTRDDLTRETLCEYFNSKPKVNIEALENIRNILNRRNIPIGEHNEKQAWLPEIAEVIQNGKGTAPGMWINQSEVVFVSMPGVPYEMKYMMESFVLPKLKANYKLPFIIHHTLSIVNIPESVLSSRLTQFELSLPKHIKLAYLPHLNTVRLRLSAYGLDHSILRSEIDYLIDDLKSILKDEISSEGELTTAASLAKALIDNNLKIGTAESCTGGFLAHQLTSVPGSSQYFEGSVISYSYDVKENLLDVSREIMLEKGAVSEEVVIQMAASLKRKLNVNYAIAISGIAGPGGGTPSKPIGTVWICVMNDQTTITRLFHFNGSRQQIIERTSIMAMEITRRLIHHLNIPLSL